MKTLQNTTVNRKRILLFFFIAILLFVGLAVRLGWHMIIKADEYANKAVRQQTSDSIVAASRGTILDRNGNELAISDTSYTVWVRPERVRTNGSTDKEIEANALAEAKEIAAMLDLDADDVYETITSEKKLLKVAKYVDLDTGRALQDLRLTGIELTETASRKYPLGDFACHVIGNVNDDNNGLSGLELYYENYLKGQDGRWVTNKDIRKNALALGTNKYYSAQDGYTIVSTIDENIQYIVEQKLQEAQETTQADRVIGLVMNPKTGEILAMAQTPSYDLNNPRDPVSEEDAILFETMTDEEKVTYWNRIWRNFCISDVYEPGSTFKLITTSIALDNGVTYPGETFQCASQQVADWTLHCWYYPRSHGYETLATAVQNSCNPVMIQLSKRLGITKYFDGVDAFGLNEKTGVDYPGEGSNILQARNTAGPVGLATMSYGQGIAVTPVSLLTAISSIANDGYLMHPHLVKAIYDGDNNLVESIEPQIKSRPISAETAEEVLAIMESVVSDGGAGNAKIAGYRIGGKTGTANKPENGGYSETDVYASFVGVAPIEDPQIALLVIVDTPKGVLYGSQTAAPCGGAILKELFRYLGIQPQYSDKELAAINDTKVTVPDVTEQSVEDAIGMLGAQGLSYELAPEIQTQVNLVVTDQFPREGEELTRGSKVTLYYEMIDTVDSYIGVDVIYDESYVPED